MIKVDLKNRIKVIKLIISDVDGVLTDGSINISSDGSESKSFSVEDGAGIAIARFADLPVAFISGRYSETTKIRLAELKVPHIFQGHLNKNNPFNELLDIYQVEPEEVAYIGDGLIDLPVMEQCGVKVAPPDSHHLVFEIADYITRKEGGKGALREMIEWILHGQGLYESALRKMREAVYLKNTIKNQDKSCNNAPTN